MSGEYRIEWKFTPEDFFEDEFEATCCGVPVRVGRGSVATSIDGDQYTLRPRLHEEMGEEIRSLFYGAQLVSRVPFSIKSPSRVHVDASGGQNIIVPLLGNEAKFFGGAVDVRQEAPDGTVLVDTRRDRFEKKLRLALLARKHRHSDATLRSMLRSLDGAVNDPADELLHLYEIKDAVCHEFAGRPHAIAALGFANLTVSIKSSYYAHVFIFCVRCWRWAQASDSISTWSTWPKGSGMRTAMLA
jgi:hypothetical protein